MSDDCNAQCDEMLVLESIYNPDEFSFKKDNSEISGQFYAFVSLPGEVKIEYQFLASPRNKLQERPGPMNQITVRYLPPIELSFTLPSDYPSTSPPRFTLVCSWLGRKQVRLSADSSILHACRNSHNTIGTICFNFQLSKLCEKLDSLWEENKGLEILFLWSSFLKEESFGFLGLESTINLSKQYSHNLVQLNRENRLLKTVTKVPGAVLEAAGPASLEESSKPVGKEDIEQTVASKQFHESPLKGRGRGKGKTYHKPPQPSVRKSENGPADIAASTSNAMKPGREIESSRKAMDLKKWQSRECKAGPKNQFDPRAVSCDLLRTSLISHILEYNKAQCEKDFQRNIYSCQICFDDKPGTQCIEFFGCGHIFCRDCVSGYFEVNIKDGNVRSLICLQEGCKSEALQSQISDLVSPELFARYDELLLLSALDEMEDIVYCPRKTCQYPVTYEKGETMARCAHCSYTFCTLCRMTYHGIDPCRIKIDSGLVAEYESASKERKEFLERKYGRRTLQGMVETGYSEMWIRGNSKSCPHCQAAIEKSDGCNKMTCWKCNTFFCWICSTRLNPSSPYNHFNSPKSPCFNLLFHGLPDSDNEEEEFEAADFFSDSDLDDSE